MMTDRVPDPDCVPINRVLFDCRPVSIAIVNRLFAGTNEYSVIAPPKESPSAPSFAQYNAEGDPNVTLVQSRGKMICCAVEEIDTRLIFGYEFVFVRSMDAIGVPFVVLYC